MTNNEQRIVLYTTGWCAYCKMLKNYLSEKGVDFAEKDIENDSIAHQELMDKVNGNFRGVPVSDINGTIILGFDRPAIDAALAN